MKVDMHMHSTVSDGSFSIPELIERAEKNGLDAIIITDHDTLSHAGQIPEHTAVRTEAGIEISSFDYEKNMRVHLLGYNIRHPEYITKFVQPTLEARHENSLKQISILNAHGYRIDISDVHRADGKYIYKQHIMEYLVRHEQVPELFGDFYYNIFKNNGKNDGICHFDIHYPAPLTALRAIKEAGGLAVLAHSGQQQNFCLIPELAENGLDGLELNHHSHSEQDRSTIRSYAEKYSLFMTGGSDFHGVYEPYQVDVGDFTADESGIEAILNGNSI